MFILGWCLSSQLGTRCQVGRACARTGRGGADLTAVRTKVGWRTAGSWGARDSVSFSFAACQLLVATSPIQIGLLILRVPITTLCTMSSPPPSKYPQHHPAATIINGSIIKSLDSRMQENQRQTKDQTTATKTSSPPRGPSSSPRPTRLRRNNSLMKRRPAGGPCPSHLGAPLQIIPARQRTRRYTPAPCRRQKKKASHERSPVRGQGYGLVPTKVLVRTH